MEAAAPHDHHLHVINIPPVFANRMAELIPIARDQPSRIYRSYIDYLWRRCYSILQAGLKSVRKGVAYIYRIPLNNIYILAGTQDQGYGRRQSYSSPTLVGLT